MTILVYGMLFEQALVAAHLLRHAGHSVGLVNMRCLKPVDEAVILEVCASSDVVVTIEDHFLIGGLYSIVAETLLKYRKTANVHAFALPGKWFKPARLNEVLAYEGFTGQQLAQRITRLMVGDLVD
ncbi:transketolase C-terminal domain-containing protein [Spirosoma telluris]|uniref:transketolase C-terminal domain-containing protein n=1 Tax=Spirosoma telluris TaxID=2183553 RepID=UPI0018DBFF6F